ncbi:unnamed protein product [Lasius platythorax]|uniref:Uncharacterized protein n=1 Tax=Lasius platythorax TaxID=488582 RepID=A0AAV2NCE3_9HYME
MVGNDGGGCGSSERGDTQGTIQVKRGVVGSRDTRDQGKERLGVRLGGCAGPRLGIADEGAGRGWNAVTRNVRVTCEVALIISYPELNFPPEWSQFCPSPARPNCETTLTSPECV